MSNKSNIKINKLECFSKAVLLDNLRKVSMLKDSQAFPYSSADIMLVNMPVSRLHPPQRYVLTENIIRARNLQWALADKGIDLFQLNGFVRMWLEGEDEPVDLLPPIVEESVEKNGEIVDLVCDGMHRVYLAHVEWKIPQVVVIKNIPKEYPYYAYPLTDPDWNHIDLREDIPAGYVKKWHRIPDNKLLYRNFNSSFKNVGGPRGNFSKG